MSSSDIVDSKNESMKSTSQLWAKLSSYGVALGALAIITGGFLFERNTAGNGRALALLGLGCGLMTFLPSRASLVGLRANRKILATALFCAAVVLFTRVCLLIGSGRTPNWELLTLEWSLSVLSLLAALFLFSRASLSGCNRTDFGIASGFFLLAFALRCFMLVTRSPISIDDEIQVFGASLPTDTPPAVSPFGSLNSFPALWYWAVYFIYKPLLPLIDRYSFEKLLMASLGAISISAWFLFLRTFCERRIALCSAWLLCFLGWHWLNSRLLYTYSIDLALISLVMLSIAVSLRDSHLGMAGVAGALSGLTVVSQKIGLMVFPVVAYLLLDSLITADSARRRKVIAIGVVWLASAAFLLLPVLLYWIGPSLAEGLLPRHSFMASGRAHALASAGLTQTEAFLLIGKDVFRQLLISESDAVRHLFRSNAPILDPIFALLFVLGFFTAARKIFSQQWARLLFVGFVIFALPMILSFPADGGLERGLARRMLGTCFFAAWLAGIGADRLSTRLLPVRFQGVFIAALCCASSVSNSAALFSSYVPLSVLSPGTVDKDLGIQRASTIKTVRELARTGLNTLYLADPQPMPKALNTKDIKWALRDLPSAEQVPSLEALRERLEHLSGKPAFVVVPASTATLGKHYQDLPTQLADIVPSYLWLPGPKDQHGIPTLWYAFVYAQ